MGLKIDAALGSVLNRELFSPSDLESFLLNPRPRKDELLPACTPGKWPTSFPLWLLVELPVVGGIWSDKSDRRPLVFGDVTSFVGFLFWGSTCAFVEEFVVTHWPNLGVSNICYTKCVNLQVISIIDHTTSTQINQFAKLIKETRFISSWSCSKSTFNNKIRKMNRLFSKSLLVVYTHS